MLAIFDLDGTLFDTRRANYMAYNEALGRYGFSIDYEYYCDACNGRHYTDFLLPIIGGDAQLMERVHDVKKCLYAKYVSMARKNDVLFSIVAALKTSRAFRTAIVSEASRDNAMLLLNSFGVTDVFDCVLAYEDVPHGKPSPDGFLMVMNKFGVAPLDTLIFEDSSMGIKAANASGANLVVVHGYS